ncbi:MAG: PIN domain-containing protein [Rubrivivax sp.]
MPAGVVILDTGPWVALHVRNERHHAWVREQFAAEPGPFLSCEAVVAETCFLLARGGFDPAKALALLERGVVRIGMSLADEAPAVRALFERYENVPASLADACLVRMSELHAGSRLMTFDADFDIYRRHGRGRIPLLMPAE